MASLPTLLKSALNDDSIDTTPIHLLPVHISYSGPAKISSYFQIQDNYVPHASSSSSSSSSSLKKAYFRGRLLVGADVTLPLGYTGQIWKSNKPSVSARGGNAEKRKHNNGIPDVGGDDVPPSYYSASSPRRSPRKHASQMQSQMNNHASKNTKKNPMMKKAPLKRQKFSMSPDISPVKDNNHDNIVEIMLEVALNEQQHLAKEGEQEKEEAAKGESSSTLESSREIVVASSPAKKKLKSDEDVKSEGDDNTVMTTVTLSSVDIRHQASPIKVEEVEKKSNIETKDTVIKSPIQRASTPPLSSLSSSHDTSKLIPAQTPSTPSQQPAADLHIHIISPRTLGTPNGNNNGPGLDWSRFIGANDNDESAVANEQIQEEGEEQNNAIHQRVIQPVANFNKFTIWNPDMELDKGDDCYIKALSEWTKLAELIHA